MTVRPLTPVAHLSYSLHAKGFGSDTNERLSYGIATSFDGESDLDKNRASICATLSGSGCSTTPASAGCSNTVSDSHLCVENQAADSRQARHRGLKRVGAGPI